MQENHSTENILISDGMTIGEFSHLFDELVGGKAMLRIFRDNRRLFNEVALQEVLCNDKTEDFVLADTMTVGEAEKAITDRLAEGCWTDIYPTGSYCITKDLVLKDICKLRPTRMGSRHEMEKLRQMLDGE